MVEIAFGTPPNVQKVPVVMNLVLVDVPALFNARAYFDIMYLEGRPVPYMVNEITRFSAARFRSKNFNSVDMGGYRIMLVISIR